MPAAQLRTTICRPEQRTVSRSSMRKTLTKIGDSTGIIIDKAILQLMNLSQGDEVEIDFVDGALVVRPARGKKTTPAQRKAQIATLKERMRSDIGGTLRKLSR